MIYLELFLGFLEVGCFAFGGAYAAIPVIRDMVLRYGWISEGDLSHMIAVSESTPGSIIVNLATFVGSRQGGFWGAVIATVSVVTPAFLIILIVTRVFKNAMENTCVKTVMEGLKSCVIGIILAVGLFMILKSLMPKAFVFDRQALYMAAGIVLLQVGYRKKKGKSLSAIHLIIASAVMGVCVYGF